MNKKKLTKLGVSLALVATVGVGATLAYLSATSDTLTNSFTVGDGFITDEEGRPAIILDEQFWTNKDTETITDDEKSEFSPSRTIKGNTYKDVLSGDTLTKDPTVHVRNGSVNSYVFVKVDGLDDLVALQNNKNETLFSVDINDDTNQWKKVANLTDVGNIGGYKDNLTNELDGVYAWHQALVTEGKTDDDGYYQSTDPLFNAIVVKDVANFLDDENQKIDLTNYDITITACAVQAKAQGTTITEADAFADATFTKQN